MNRSARYGWFVVGLIGLFVLFGPMVTLASPQDAEPMNMPTSTPAGASETTLTAAPTPEPTLTPAKQDAFSSGTTRLTVVVGNGYAFDNSYLIIGGGAGYFIADGLDVGLDFEYWTGSSPNVIKISPRLDYVFNTGGALRPYAGAFFRRTLIDGKEDLDSIGGRAGLYFMSGKGVYIGAGLVYESYLSCDTVTYSSCDDTYPEIAIAFSF
jgi:hypothetical protein